MNTPFKIKTDMYMLCSRLFDKGHPIVIDMLLSCSKAGLRDGKGILDLRLKGAISILKRLYSCIGCYCFRVRELNSIYNLNIKSILNAMINF